MSSLNSSTSSKKDDGLKLDRESRQLNDSEEEEEEEGDLLEDEDEVSAALGGESRNGWVGLCCITHAFFLLCR